MLSKSLLQFSRKVTYNGHGMNEFVPQRTAAYISQQDVYKHYETLKKKKKKKEKEKEKEVQ